ncbi:hypothetical protein GCM10028798_10360 [Humibacter antri]
MLDEYTHADADAGSGNRHTESNGQPDADRYARSNRHADADRNPHPDRRADPERNSYAYHPAARYRHALLDSDQRW